MTTQTYAATVHGVAAHVVTIEADLNRRGFPLFKIVGLPHKSVAEAKERVRSAIRNAGFSFPRGRITINLSPADVPKYGSGLDLAIALSILALDNPQLSQRIRTSVFIGELSLDGSIRPVAGLMAKLLGMETNKESIYVPEDQVFETEVAAHILHKHTFHKSKNLKELVTYLIQNRRTNVVQGQMKKVTHDKPTMPVIKGQKLAKRALSIALAGRHHVLFIGPPGVGKSMLAETAAYMQSDVGDIGLQEILKVQSLSGPITELPSRPFRRVHHTISRAGLIGGGNPAIAGEITRAHKGILFLDEVLEFARPVLDSLRQPLDKGFVALKRGKYQYTFPSDVMIIATANPCPCGFFGHPTKECICTAAEVSRYRKRLSGPLLDRISMYVYLDPVNINELSDTERIQRASVIRKKMCNLDDKAERCLNKAYLKLSLSMRGRDKVRDVAQTIAQLNNHEMIHEEDVAEALQFREIPFHMS